MTKINRGLLFVAVALTTMAGAVGTAAAQTYDPNLDTVADGFLDTQAGLISFVTTRIVPLVLVAIAFVYGLKIAFKQGQMALKKVSARFS